MINWTAIRSHVIEAQHVLHCIARLVSRVIDLFVVEDVFKKEKQKIVFFFKCEEGTETETLKSI